MKKIIVSTLMLFTCQVFAVNNNTITINQQIELAINDLSNRLEISDASEVVLTKISEVTWSSGALGCPQPNMQYTQALVPGRLILLNVNDKTYRYHAKLTGSPFYCADKFAQSPSLPDSAL
jgi:hypothetical protein